jgi:hypothetical protein
MKWVYYHIEALGVYRMDSLTQETQRFSIQTYKFMSILEPLDLHENFYFLKHLSENDDTVKFKSLDEVIVHLSEKQDRMSIILANCLLESL